MGDSAWQRISKPFLVPSVWGLETRALARQCQYCSSFTMPGMVQHEMGIITVRHLPTVCPPDITTHDQISNLPVHIWLLQVIKDWRWEQPGNENKYVHRYRTNNQGSCNLWVGRVSQTLPKCKNKAHIQWGPHGLILNTLVRRCKEGKDDPMSPQEENRHKIMRCAWGYGIPNVISAIKWA